MYSEHCKCNVKTMKRFYESLREHAVEVIDFEKKKIVLLTKEQRELHKKLKVFYIKKFMQKYAKDNNYCKVRDYCHYIGKYRGVAHSICNLKYTVPNEFCVVFQNRSNYDYHFIANEFKLQFEYLGEKTKSKKLFLFQ